MTNPMFTRFGSLLLSLSTLLSAQDAAQNPLPAASASAPAAAGPIVGFRDAATEWKWEKQFLAVPDPARAREHLHTLTIAPHMMGTPEDKATADYVAKRFREAGLQTEIVEYKVWCAGRPEKIEVEVTYPKEARRALGGPEKVSDDPYQDDPRVVIPFNAASPSGEAEADVVYANYGRLEDFKKLEEMKIDIRGKIVLVRYGGNFRGVKTYIAEQRGAAGVLIYSDPADDGYFKGDVYPRGPWRPATGVQRGSIKYMFKHPGDPTTPGVASTPDLPMSERVPPEKSDVLPHTITTPISYGDASIILSQLGGPESPRDWQGGLPFTYHLGVGPVRVHMNLKQNYAYRTIWDVIGTIPGSDSPEQWVVAGNHRDAWVYGAVDPNSGTTAMLESVQGLGELLHSGWRPKRTIVIGSWDGEEQGLIGSTEWAEQHGKDLAQAVAYFNMDSAVSGPSFTGSAVPSLKQFVRDVSKAVPAPDGSSVYSTWMQKPLSTTTDAQMQRRQPNAASKDAPVGDLGSGSDYSAFIQHVGVPSTDVESDGPYGVYHSAFDNFAWYIKFADPKFLYSQEMARVFGVELLRMADTDVLPHDYETYGREIGVYLEAAEKRYVIAFGATAPGFDAARDAARQLAAAGAAAQSAQDSPAEDAAARARLNHALVEAEHAFLLEKGLPGRPWYRHAVYAPGEYTGYAAVVLPGVSDAIDAKNQERAQEQLGLLTHSLQQASDALRAAR